MIRTVTVRVVTSTSTICVPRYVRDQTQDPRHQGYKAVAEVRDERSVALETLDYEFSRAVALMERTAGIAEVLDLNEAFTSLLQQAKVLQTTLRQKRRLSPVA